MINVKSATLIKRYKRFLADVIIDGEIHTIHVPNTGAMTNCGQEGDTIWYSTSDNPKRKYAHTWELTERNALQDNDLKQGALKGKDLICVNPQRANMIVGDALRNHKIPQLQYEHVQAEVKYGNSRIDFQLSNCSTSTDSSISTDNSTAQSILTDGSSPNQLCLVEVKSCTLLLNGKGYFPDAVTVRGQKHLGELMAIAEQGHRAVLVFAILHSGINDVMAAEHIDPKYAQLLQQAKNSGVEVICYKPDLNDYFDYSIA